MSDAHGVLHRLAALEPFRVGSLDRLGAADVVGSRAVVYDGLARGESPRVVSLRQVEAAADDQ